MKSNLIDLIYESQAIERTGLYIGRFSSVTIGHKKVIDIMSSNHLKSYVLLVSGKKTKGDKKNPFPEKIILKMLRKVAPKNVKIKVVDTGFLPKAIEKINIKNSKISIYSGPDRLEGYRKQKKYFPEWYDIKIYNSEMMAPRQKEISGTKLRQHIKNNDFESFKMIAPQEIWSMFDELKKYMEK